MESPKREIDLRPRSRDLLRVRSEDLAFDPVKDRQQLQELKREKFMEHQIQLQEHQRQWRIQQRKLQRRLQRRKQRIADKQNTNKVEDAGKKCQHKKQEAWKKGKASKICSDDDESKDILDKTLVRMVEAPLEAHFLKGVDKKKGMKSDESDSLTEMSSFEDWDDINYGIDINEMETTEKDTWKFPSFSTRIRHRHQCARCHIYHHYFQHGHSLATVRAPQPTALLLSHPQSRRDDRSLSVGVCSPCDYISPLQQCLGKRLSWNHWRPHHERATSLIDHFQPFTESERINNLGSPSSQCKTPQTTTKFHITSEALQSQEKLRLLAERRRFSNSRFVGQAITEESEHSTSVTDGSRDGSRHVDSADDGFGFNDNSYNINYGDGDGYYVLVVVDDVDASTDLGSDNDEAFFGISSNLPDNSSQNFSE